MESEDDPGLHRAYVEAWEQGYEDGFSTGLVCRLCGAIVSRNTAAGGGPSYRERHDQWHEAHDGR